MLEEWTIIKLLNRVQVLSVTKNYVFNKQNRINSKPVLQTGTENLKEFRCFLPLHCNFCNPQKALKLIENCAKSRKILDWVYNGTYLGTYVIDSVSKNIKNQIKDIIIYAEVTFNLLEYPYDDEFCDQINAEIDLSEFEQYTSSSNKYTQFTTTIKDSIVTNMQEAVSSSLVSASLSDTGKEFLTSACSNIINDLTAGSITEIYTKSENYSDIISSSTVLSTSDKTILAGLIEAIPQTIIDSALRS